METSLLVNDRVQLICEQQETSPGLERCLHCGSGVSRDLDLRRLFSLWRNPSSEPQGLSYMCLAFPLISKVGSVPENRQGERGV